jgi:Protein of unknown function (DUF2948)
MTALKLIALDAEDLSILAAHLQDAVGLVGEMSYLRKPRRFVALISRFDWASTLADPAAPPRRRKTALRIERVLSAQVQGIDLAAKGTAVSLLTVQFEPDTEGEPAGFVTLLYAGDAAVRLKVECIEIQLEDLEAAWTTETVPRHGGD